jgi:hypothetical protein
MDQMLFIAECPQSSGPGPDEVVKLLICRSLRVASIECKRAWSGHYWCRELLTIIGVGAVIGEPDAAQEVLEARI